MSKFMMMTSTLRMIHKFSIYVENSTKNFLFFKNFELKLIGFNFLLI